MSKDCKKDCLVAKLFRTPVGTEENPPLENFVKVTGQASLELEPDVIEFCIKISSSKSDLVDCRSSVKKREEYICAILKKNSIQTISSNETIHKVEKSSANDFIPGLQEKEEEASEISLEKELCVKTEKISKYLNVVSICREKLDFRVEISQPLISFSASAMDRATKTVLQMAVSNTELKARNLIQIKNSPFKASLGPILFSTEDSFEVQDSSPISPDNSNEFELLKWKKFNRRLSTRITTAYRIVTILDRRFRTVI